MAGLQERRSTNLSDETEQACAACKLHWAAHVCAFDLIYLCDICIYTHEFMPVYALHCKCVYIYICMYIHMLCIESCTYIYIYTHK